MSGASKSGGFLKPTWSMALMVTLVLLAACFVVPKIDEWTIENESANIGTQNAVSTQRQTVSQTEVAIPTVSYEWQRITLPSGDADWPSWIEIPMGHTITYCDPVNDPSCSAKDFSNARFDLQCRSLADGTPRDWESEECAWSAANRARAKGTESMPLLYRFRRES